MKGIGQVDAGETARRLATDRLGDRCRVKNEWGNWHQCFGRGTAPGLFTLFLGQMQEVLVIILLVAAVISGLLGEWADTVVIMIIVILNGVWGCAGTQGGAGLRAWRRWPSPWPRSSGGGCEEVGRRPWYGDLIWWMRGILFLPMRLMEHVSLEVDESVLTVNPCR